MSINLRKETKETKLRTYELTRDNNFVVSSIGLLRSIRLVPEEMFGVKLEIPPLDVFINGLKIDRTHINDTGEDNYFNFSTIRKYLRTIDPYSDDGDYNNESIEFYNLEQVLISGDIDASAIYNISDEEMISSIFTPYAIIRIDGEDNYFDAIKIEEEYFPRI
jgi:hypothetical protein